MVQYIDKDTLVVEIEKLISNGKVKLKESEECKDYESYVALAERIATCINVLSLIGTLEEKDVDLEEEFADFLEKENAYIDDNNVISYYNGSSFNHTCDIYPIAKHFFELGLKAKGE